MWGSGGGGARSVSEVAEEKGDCAAVRASARVPCFQENIVEEVGDGEWFRGFSTPREEAGAKCAQRVLVGCIHAVPNRARKLPEVGVDKPIGGINIQCVALHVGCR